MAFNRKKSPGFTLVELMVVLVILGIVSIGAITAITSQNKVYHSEEDLIEMQMSAKVAMDRISFLLRMAGVGCRDSFGNNLKNGNMKVFKSDVIYGTEKDTLEEMFVIDDNSVGTPDQLTFAGAVRYVGQITSIPANDKFIMHCNETPKVSATPAKSNIFISPQDDNRLRPITAITSGVNPTVTFAPVLSNIDRAEILNFLNATPSVEAHVYQVQAFTIRVVTPPNSIPSLRIDDNIDTSGIDLDIIDNVEDLQFRYGLDTDNNDTIDTWSDNPASIADIRAVRFFLLLRSAKRDREYNINGDTKTYTLAGTDLDFSDNFHRLLVESTVILRNSLYD